MSCGFGAVVLLFLIIKHNTDSHMSLPINNIDPQPELALLNREIREGQAGLAALRSAIATTDREITEATASRNRITRQIDEARNASPSVVPQDAAVERLQRKLVNTEREVKRLQAEQQQIGDATRTFVGDGQREYLSGLNLSGKRVLILLDSSASMLDETIVNIIRRRNMSDKVKLGAKKWRQAIRTVEWLSTRFPPDGQYQIYTFNTKTKAVVAGSERKWLKVSDKPQLNITIKKLSDIIPSDGTSLENAFAAAANLRPLPENIFLITDGLPTQGKVRSKKTAISGEERLTFFNKALKKLPAGVPINIILAPMEGDPMAAPAFWKLAQLTRGAFLSPSKDWP